MVRFNARTFAALAFALVSFTAVEGQANDEMELQVRRTGPAVKTAAKARSTEIIILRGEARMRKEEERQGLRERAPASATAESHPTTAAKRALRAKPLTRKALTTAKATLASSR